MQIDAADSAGGQRHNGVEIVSDGRPDDIVQSNVCDPMENGFYSSFCGNSFSKIGSVQNFIATARHINEGAVEIEEERWDRLSGGLRDYTNAAVALSTGAKGAVSAVLHSSSAGLGCERFSHVHVSCRSEMFLYLVRGIFCEWTHGLSCSDGGLTRFR
jgi:hypothetical protein